MIAGRFIQLKEMVIILKNIPLIRKLDNFKDFFFQSCLELS